MYRIHGSVTQNTLKTLYVLEEVVGDFEYQFVDLRAGEQRSEAFRRMTPIGKVPVLDHNGEYLFESGAICRYVANVNDSSLYPAEALERARVDQWMDYFSCHLGHWLNKLFFEAEIKPKFGLGDPDEKGIAEARKYAALQLGIVDRHLDGLDWLANDSFSIADLFAFAYVEQHRMIDMPLHDFPNVEAWLERTGSRPSIARARARLPQ